MKWWKYFVLFILIGCSQKNDNEVSIYENTFTMTLPAGVTEDKTPYKIFGNDIIYWKAYTNNDSTIQVKIEVNKEMTPPLSSLLPYLVDELRHFDASMIVLDTGTVRVKKTEKLSILYEIPIYKSLSGYTVARNVFFTGKGCALVDVICKFKIAAEKEKCLILTKQISNSINISE